MAMKYKIEYISTFYSDLIDFISFLENFPRKAGRILEKIDKLLIGLAHAPEMYQVYEDLPVFRKISVEDYLIFYKIDEANKVVEIHRLIYGRMDIKSHLQK